MKFYTVKFRFHPQGKRRVRTVLEKSPKTAVERIRAHFTARGKTICVYCVAGCLVVGVSFSR